MSDIYVITTLCLFPLILLTIIVGGKVKFIFSKYSKEYCSAPITASEAARRLLDDAGLFDVAVTRIAGNLTDNYNPKTRTVSLSDAVYDSNSVAAMGVMAHEIGHVMQYSDEYIPVKIRGILVPVCSITSNLALPLLLIGLLFEVFLGANTLSDVLFFLGVTLYSVYTIFTLITLPVEFNASKRARIMLVDNGIILPQDEKKVKEMLNSAAMTYVMSFAVSLLQLLRIVAIFGGGKRRR